jgi:citrate synthase
MKIGEQPDPSTAICVANSAQIIVRGHDLNRELVGHISFTEHFWLLVTGALPSAAQRTILDATLVAIAEHGLVPSVQAARMTYAAAPEGIQGAIAAGILGCGSVIAGSAENAGRFLNEIVHESDREQVSLSEAAGNSVRASRIAKRPIPGYGHPMHKARDPRAERLLSLTTEMGLSGRHIAAAREVEELIPSIVGRVLVMNVSAAIGAVLLDAGFPVTALRGVPILARTASLVAHIVEEMSRPIGFVLAEYGEKAVRYSGSAPADFKIET